MNTTTIQTTTTSTTMPIKAARSTTAGPWSALALHPSQGLDKHLGVYRTEAEAMKAATAWLIEQAPVEATFPFAIVMAGDIFKDEAAPFGLVHLSNQPRPPSFWASTFQRMSDPTQWTTTMTTAVEDLGPVYVTRSTTTTKLAPPDTDRDAWRIVIGGRSLPPEWWNQAQCDEWADSVAPTGWRRASKCIRGKDSKGQRVLTCFYGRSK
jgi:hypothetical protein